MDSGQAFIPSDLLQVGDLKTLIYEKHDICRVVATEEVKAAIQRIGINKCARKRI